MWSMLHEPDSTEVKTGTGQGITAMLKKEAQVLRTFIIDIHLD